ncbi:MAG: GNAT family N-acetyltransferase [Rikenellaceae bacterium]
MLTYSRIIGAADLSAALFAEAWKIYEYSFPRNERRTLEDQELRMADDRYNFEVALNAEDEVVGIVCYWIFSDEEGAKNTERDEDAAKYIYLEHLATSKELRNGGFGAKTLDHLKSLNLPMLLEIEPPEDELTRRRQGFYERSGFVLNEYNHRHTPYRADTGDVTLRIMSYPTEFSRVKYDNFCRSQSSVMPKF